LPRFPAPTPAGARWDSMITEIPHAYGVRNFRQEKNFRDHERPGRIQS